MSDSVERECLEAYTRDVGRGIIRIDYDTMDELKISTGDIVEIEGKRKTVSKAMPLYPSDEGKNLCRVDKLTRENMRIEKGDSIKIRKTTACAAQKIIVKAIEAFPAVNLTYLRDAFESVPMINGDRLMAPYFGGKITYGVVETTPPGPVVSTAATFFQLDPQPENPNEETCIHCKYCKKAISPNNLSINFCGIDCQIRWTVSDELKNRKITIE